ncbi:MAG TPA: S46 family peptidase [Thermoanaerobaculia bacterium]
MKHLLVTFLLLSLTFPLLAVDGKWTPQQVLELDAKWLAELGLELPPSRLWDPSRGTGLLAAAISTGGCSAGWISATGLFITNHHCIFGVLQEHATPENDIITNGFLARSMDAELRSRTMRVTIPRRFVDVTAEVLASVPAKAGDAERYLTITRKENEIVARCEAQPNTRCRVAAHDGGVQYVLQEMAEIADVRLVYAPQRAVGEFGGEVDNWMWPRHTGDFAIARAYVDGKPYAPEFYFPLASSGVKPGDFVMALGYPGVTFRSLTAIEMDERRMFFTARAAVYRDWIGTMESATADNPAGTIAVANLLKTLLNRQKNGEGQLAGLRRGSILEKQTAADRAVLEWAAGRSDRRAAVAAHEGLTKLANEKKEWFEHDFLLEHLRWIGTGAPTGPRALVLAIPIARGAEQRAKADNLREAPFMDRNLPRLRETLNREQKNLFTPVDRLLLADFVRRARALPDGRKIEAIERAFAGADSDAALLERIDSMFASTRLFDEAERLKMFDEPADQLRARKDPLIELAAGLSRQLDSMAERTHRWNGTVLRLRPEWRRAVIAHAGKPIAPDGNGTLRVTFAHVRGYQPRDGVWYTPQTTLAGVVEKHTGEEPFDVPDSILKAAADRDAAHPSRWADAALKDLPVNFLADADTTSGNSGSPVVNGRGELVGVNFDRVWENVANDFGYNPDIARNVTADVRYMLWILEEIERADELLRELGIEAKKQP